MTGSAASASVAIAQREADRSRALRTLFAGVGLGSTGYIAAGTVSAIVATELAGTSSLAGIPAATVVLGSAFGSAWLSALMARRGTYYEMVRRQMASDAKDVAEAWQ